MKGIPILHVEPDCIARAWENSLIALHEKGCNVKTEYDKPEDPPSKDATMTITITDPLAEPMIHKDFPGGPMELQEYVMEMCDGSRTTWFATRTIPRTPAGSTRITNGSSNTKSQPLSPRTRSKPCVKN